MWGVRLRLRLRSRFGSLDLSSSFWVRAIIMRGPDGREWVANGGARGSLMQHGLHVPRGRATTPGAPGLLRRLVLHDAGVSLADSVPEEAVDVRDGGHFLQDVRFPVYAWVAKGWAILKKKKAKKESRLDF